MADYELRLPGKQPLQKKLLELCEMALETAERNEA